MYSTKNHKAEFLRATELHIGSSGVVFEEALEDSIVEVRSCGFIVLWIDQVNTSFVGEVACDVVVSIAL